MSLNVSEHVLKEILKGVNSMSKDLRELKKVQIETRDNLREVKSELSEIKTKMSELSERQDDVCSCLEGISCDTDNLSKISSTLDDVHEANHGYKQIISGYSYKELTYRTTKEIQEDIRDTLHQIRDNQSSSKPRSSADSNVSDETD